MYIHICRCTMFIKFLSNYPFINYSSIYPEVCLSIYLVCTFIQPPIYLQLRSLSTRLPTTTVPIYPPTDKLSLCSIWWMYMYPNQSLHDTYPIVSSSNVTSLHSWWIFQLSCPFTGRYHIIGVRVITRTLGTPDVAWDKATVLPNPQGCYSSNTSGREPR